MLIPQSLMFRTLNYNGNNKINYDIINKQMPVNVDTMRWNGKLKLAKISYI